MSDDIEYLVLSVAEHRYALAALLVHRIDTDADGQRRVIVRHGDGALSLSGFASATLTRIPRAQILDVPTLVACGGVCAIAWPEHGTPLLVLSPLSLSHPSLPFRIGAAS